MTNILSPLVKVNESFQFYMNGRVFEMDNSNEIKEIEGNKIDSKLKSAIAAFESFEFGNETIKWFHGSSKFVFNLKENNFSMNESVIENSFSKHVLGSGAVRYNDVTKAELFESLPTLLENFVNLDFAAQFEGNNNIVNVFKLEEKVFVARLNTENRISNFFKADNANQVVDYVSEKTGKSAATFLSELVEGQAIELAKIEKNIAKYESMISFLKDQRGLLAEADKSISEIKAADILINEEIANWEAKIVELSTVTEAVKYIDTDKTVDGNKLVKFWKPKSRDKWIEVNKDKVISVPNSTVIDTDQGREVGSSRGPYYLIIKESVNEGRADGGKMARTHVVYALRIQEPDGAYLASYRVAVKKGPNAEERAKELAKKDLGKNLGSIKGISKALNPELHDVAE